MDLEILNSEIQNFINDHCSKDVVNLAFQKNPFPKLDWAIILNQIEAKSKAKNKLPTWFNSKKIIYPSKISIEQTSSETTALYKSKIITGKSLIDLTGGFGVDAFYFAKKLENITHCEINIELSNIVNHNFKALNVFNVSTIFGNSTEILKNTNQNWDWIYIDPSRRNDVKGKVFMLRDCLPNVPENLNLYLKKSNSILIKTAPILDISAGLSELKFVKNIHIVAVNNEVKELLWEINHNYLDEITIKTINFTKNKTDYFEFIYNNTSKIDYYLPEQFLYEPNAAIMKSGGFEALANFYQIKKLHKHSHLYTHHKSINFPGRVFKIKNIWNYNKKEMKCKIENTTANISVRNFPETVEFIRKKWKIKTGGNVYLFFTTNANNEKIVLACDKE